MLLASSPPPPSSRGVICCCIPPSSSLFRSPLVCFPLSIMHLTPPFVCSAVFLSGLACLWFSSFLLCLSPIVSPCVSTMCREHPLSSLLRACVPDARLPPSSFLPFHFYFLFPLCALRPASGAPPIFRITPRDIDPLRPSGFALFFSFFPLFPGKSLVIFIRMKVTACFPCSLVGERG